MAARAGMGRVLPKCDAIMKWNKPDDPADFVSLFGIIGLALMIVLIFGLMNGLIK